MDPDEPSPFWQKRHSHRVEDEHTDWDDAPSDLEEEELAVNRELGRAEMTDWFYRNFEQPTHWDSEEKSFIFPFGGPFDASDVLFSEFGKRFPEEFIIAVADELERDGTSEWAPTSHGDYYDNDDLELDSEISKTNTGIDLKSHILSEIERLKSLVNELDTPSALIGHNRPPEADSSAIYNEADKIELLSIIEANESTISAAESSASEVIAQSNRLLEWTRRFSNWVLKKADILVDEAIKEGVKTSFSGVKFYVILNFAADLARQIIEYAGSILN